MNAKIPFNIRRKQFWGIAILGFAMFILKIIFLVIPAKTYPIEDKNIVWLNVNQPKSKISLTEFNPNELSSEQWLQLGFSDKQVATILKYKNIVGGQFVSKDQLKKCYAISEDKYRELAPFILLPDHQQRKSLNEQNTFNKKLNIKGKFNPDTYSAKDWETMGFSPKQAIAIDKYKNYLGGSFVSKEKFRECFIISDENFNQLNPFLTLPEKTPDSYKHKNYSSTEKYKSIKLFQFDPNTLALEGWVKLGFSDKQAQVIINYRDKNLKGSFKTLEDLKNCFVISNEKYHELLPYIQNLPSSQSAKPSEQIKTINQIQQPTDFSKVDLNSITYRQLREFGFNEKDAAMILGFRKKLGGFVLPKQLVDTYDIDKELAEKLIKTAILNTDNVVKYTLTNAPEDWLKSHPYFKYSAEKIIFYRISNPDDRKIWKFLKLKSEYEQRMKLYLKSESE